MAAEVRVRFAPSPTGALHIGGVRTALYNYLFAKKMGGKMVLRIEDTDQNRYVEGAEAYIKEALEWCGIIPDESPTHGGPYGPYRQSERLDHYQQYSNQLLAKGHAYYAFDTPEEIEAMRERQKAAKSPVQQYAIETRMEMRNSLTLSQDEVTTLISSGSPYVVRLKIPQDKEIVMHDIVRGEVRVQSSTMDDKVLMKSDGFPTYHLANVVDDHLMQITHVIRGEEWLPSAPLHSLLYEVLGWSDTMPQMAHLPLLLKPEGTGKLSKRDADKHGFPIFPLNWIDPKTNDFAEGFREQGYLPEAMVNFLAFLGWNPGSEEEMFDMKALISAFDPTRIGKSGAKFDIEKAKWYNQQYLRKSPIPELGGILARYAKANHVDCDRNASEEIASLMVERITFPQDLWNQSHFFFVSPSNYDEKFARKKWTQEGVDVLNVFAESLENINIEDSEATKQKLYDIADAQQVGFGRVMPALRLALTGSGGGPDIFSIIKIIGKDETKVRIIRAIELLEV